MEFVFPLGLLRAAIHPLQASAVTRAPSMATMRRLCKFPSQGKVPVLFSQATGKVGGTDCWGELGGDTGRRHPPQHRALLPAGPWMNFMECGSLDHLVSPSMCEPLRKEMACFVLKLKLTMWPRMTLTSNQSSYLCFSVLGLQTCAPGLPCGSGHWPQGSGHASGAQNHSPGPICFRLLCSCVCPVRILPFLRD